MSLRRSSKTLFRARVAVCAFSILIAIAGGASCANAASGIVIDEIMYDTPGINAGHQWVEIENTGSEPFDLSAKDLRFFDKSGAHVIAVYGNSPATLPSGSVAVIVDKPAVFLVDHPNFSGALFDSVVSLTASDTIGLKTAEGTVLATATYTSVVGAKGDGNSLHLSGSLLVAGAPNPGALGTPGPITIVRTSVPPSSIAKPSSPSSSFSKSTASTRASTSTTLSHPPSYDKGISAPTAEAQTSAVGAAVPPPSESPDSFLQYLVSSIWFALFLALLIFSSTALIGMRGMHSRDPSP